MRHDNYLFLTKGAVEKVIPTLAIPAVISMLSTSLYNIVDTWYVGLLNTQATAAVGVVFPVMSIIHAIGFFWGQGSGAFISRALGAKRRGEAEKMATTAFMSSMSCGVVLALLGLIFLSPLSRILGSTPTILPYTEQYLGVILLGAPFLTCSMTLNNQMRLQGNAAMAMYGIMSGAILNVALVPVFMFVFDLGILGTAIGTVTGQAVGLIVLLYVSRKRDNIRISVKYVPTEWVAYRKVLVEVWRGGTPSLTRQGLASVSTAMLNVVAARYGDAAVAGMSIVTRLSFIVFSVILGVGHGYQPFCGFNYGAGLYDRLRKGFFFSIRFGLVVILLVSIPGLIYAEEIVDVFRHDADVVRVGAAAFRWQILSYPFAVVVAYSNMTLQVCGRAIPANILSATRNGIYFIPLILILPYFLGVTGVEVCQAAADVLSFVTAIPLMYVFFNRMGKKG